MAGPLLSRPVSRECGPSILHKGSPNPLTSSEKVMDKGKRVILSPSENLVDLTSDQYHALWPPLPRLQSYTISPSFIHQTSLECCLCQDSSHLQKPAYPSTPPVGKSSNLTLEELRGGSIGRGYVKESKKQKEEKSAGGRKESSIGSFR
jgi:hypothetical protein